MYRLNHKGQNTLEYVLLITAVIAAFLLVQHYLSRGLQGRLRDASDNIGNQFDAKATTSNFTTDRTSVVKETNIGGVSRSELLGPETSARTGAETVGPPTTE